MIDIEMLCDLDGGGDTMGYFAKGHHDAAQFIEAAHDQYDEEDLQLENVKQGTRRCVPLPKGYGAGMQLCTATPGTRGAFAVTYIDTKGMP